MNSCGVHFKIRDSYDVFFKELFTSDRKRMSFIFRTDESRTGFRLCTKGASELLLEASSHYLNSKTGEVIKMENDVREKTSNAITEMAEKALRTIAIAFKDVDITESKSEFFERMSKPESRDPFDVLTIEKSDYVLVGIIGIEDIIREGVDEAVRKCRIGGVQVKMITGDNRITAAAIAKKVSILDVNDNGEESVIEGVEFMRLIEGIICKNCKDKPCDCFKNKKEKQKFKKVQKELEEKNGKKKKEKKKKMSKEEKEAAKKNKRKVRMDTIKNLEVFEKLSKKIKVMARSRPEDKYAMILGLKELGHVVGVTGDGTNDAPALKKADVGLAMGITGTEVAKQAADILIMDDNFSTIVNAILWGRNIFGSVRKFLTFQLTVNLCAVLIILVGACVAQTAVISAVQMLWVNMIMDSLGSVALATEPPPPSLIYDKPYGRKDHVINLKMAKHIIGQFIYQMTVVLIFLLLGPRFLYEGDEEIQNSDGYVIDGEDFDEEKYGASRHYTYLFNVFVWLQIFNFMNARKIKDEFNIFTGVSGSFYFFLMVGIIICFQVLAVSVFGEFFGVHQWGLHIFGWLICIAFGLGGWFVSVFLKLIPEEKIFPCFKEKGLGNSQENTVSKNHKKTLSESLRQKHDAQYYRKRSSSIILMGNK